MKKRYYHANNRRGQCSSLLLLMFDEKDQLSLSIETNYCVIEDCNMLENTIYVVLSEPLFLNQMIQNC